MESMAFVVAGFFVGAVVGLTGVGGGSLMTPLLIFFFGVKPYLAVGTDLLFAAVTKAGGSVSLARRRLVDWPVVGLLAAGSVPAALLTLWAIRRHGATDPALQHLMTSVLGGALLLTAAATFYKALAGKAQPRQLPAAERAAAARPRHWALPVLLGAVIGSLVTLTSVGAGAIGVVVLMLLYPRLPLPRIVGADIAHAVPLTLVAGLGHAAIGSVDWRLLGLLLAGSLPGIWLGSRLMTHTPERLVRTLLAGLLGYAGLKLVWM
ncbi:sulfite exporter TauE/SafE family protein [Ottowia sp.]|uniref:sulfite exporter TauE/SafE family protein n=1 Tax=Ottowia sp. TaxID=1898956 RepID=UPI00262A662A|nr:sulfite exporter TauE/SafE family protein [Ottowia sp.]